MEKKRRTIDFSRKKKQSNPSKSSEKEGVRLNKYVASCGIGSRRKAADFVKEGLVKVNGQVLTDPSYLVQPKDEVQYKGKAIKPAEKMVYLLLNKPKGYITTLNDEKDRKTIMDILGDRIKERVFPVGRLDRNTTGLLLITNDGDLAQKLSHPRYKVEKLYHVVLDKPLTDEHFESILQGIELEDGMTHVDSMEYVAGQPRTELGVSIHVGKNRIVRRLFEHFGYQVIRLDRVYYAGLTKKDLPRGRYRHLKEKEVIMLKHFVR